MGLTDLVSGGGTRCRPLVLLQGETEITRVVGSA
jgi:hypothetical protein